MRHFNSRYTRTFCLQIAFGLSAFHCQAQLPELLVDWWVPTGDVDAAVADGATNTLFISGDFQEVRPPGSMLSGVVLGLEDEGWPVLHSPKPNTTVRAVVADGAGGWYIGGEFNTVGGVPARRLAHILSDGSLDNNWTAGANGTVRTLAIGNGLLYVGGDFTTAGDDFVDLGGEPRERLAAFQLSNGTLSDWHEGFSGDQQVRTLHVANGSVYVGGTFTTLGGAPRTRIAALDPFTGAASPWAPTANSAVNEFAFASGVVYVGGAFSQVNSTNRSSFAGIDAITGVLLPWSANVNGEVNAMELHGDTLFLGGTFTQIRSAGRDNIGAIVLGATTPLNWLPEANGSVYEMQVRGNRVFVAGGFSTIGAPGVERLRLACVDRYNASATPWIPHGSGDVYTLAFQGDQVYAGGAFLTMPIRRRSGLAAFDMQTGRPRPWKPNITGTGRLLLKGDSLLVGVYPGIKIFNTTTAAQYPWVANLGTNLIDMVEEDGILYVSGGLVETDQVAMVAFDMSTGNLLADFAPVINNTVTDMVAHAGQLYMVGNFTEVGGLPRNYIASVSLADGSVSNWAPDADANTYTLALSEDNNGLYVGGLFTELGGATRQRFGKVSLQSGAALPWVCNTSGLVMDIHVGQSSLLVGGYFQTIDGVPRGRLAEVNPASNVMLWNPVFDGVVNVIATSPGFVFVGGDFSQVGNPEEERFRLAVYSVDNTTSVLDPIADAPVAATVFPNPTQGLFTLVPSDDASVRRIRIMDALGHNVLQVDPYPSDRYVLDLSGQAAGLYHVVVTQDSRSISLRVVVDH